MVKVAYLTRSHAYDHILKHFHNDSHQRFEIAAAWSPSRRTLNKVNKFKSLRFIRDILHSRPVAFDISDSSSHVSIRSFKIVEIPFLMINILTFGFLTTPLFRIREKIIIHRAKLVAQRNNLVITTDDFPVELWSPESYIMEFRGMPKFIQVERFREVFFHEFDLKYQNHTANSVRGNAITLLNDKRLQSIIVYSLFVREQILDLTNFIKPIEVVPLTLPKYEYQILQTKEKRVNSLLFIGRNDPNKGLDFALKISRMSGIRLIIVGSYSSEYARKLNLLPFVDFRGSLNRFELFKVMGETSVLLAPSIETFGYSIAEAVNMKMNVIVSKYAGISEYLDSKENVVIMEDFQIDLWQDAVVKSLRATNLKCKIEAKNP